MNNAEIQRVLQLYKEKKERDRNYYHTTVKNDKDRMEHRRQTSRKYAEVNRDKQAEYRLKNKERINLRNMVNYYSKLNRLEEFKTKKSYKYRRAIELNIIQEES